MKGADLSAGYSQPLAEKLRGASLPVPYVLACATEVAVTLRELHHRGLGHGDVGLHSIRVSESGVWLTPAGRQAQAADPRNDVVAFGAVLYEALTGGAPRAKADATLPAAVRSPASMSDVRNEAIRLAQKCLDGAPDMKRVLAELRLLVISARRLSKAPRKVPARLSDVEPLPSSTSTAICQRCGGNAPLIEPRTILEKLFGRIGLVRRCSLCGYRFFILHFQRHPRKQGPEVAG